MPFLGGRASLLHGRRGQGVDLVIVAAWWVSEPYVDSLLTRAVKPRQIVILSRRLTKRS